MTYDYLLKAVKQPQSEEREGLEGGIRAALVNTTVRRRM